LWAARVIIISQHHYATNGAWVEIAIGLQADCGPFPCYRVISARTFAAVKVGRIRLAKPQVIR
jgi:hypothetical protein